MSALSAGLRAIVEALERGEGSFVLERAAPSDGMTQPFALAVGSIRGVHVDGGLLLTLGLSREQVERLREMCDEALVGSSSWS